MSRIITNPEFDPVNHVYSHAGRVLPSVTQIIGGLHSFGAISAEVLDAACQRGTAVHLACELDDCNDLDEDSLDETVSGYLHAWRRFTREKSPVWQMIEEPLADTVLGFAGTPDRYGLIDGRSWTIDIKTSVQSHPVWGLQTAAYAHLIAQLTQKHLLRGTVQLRSDGTYRLIPWSSLTDWPTFLSLVTVNNWRKQYAN